MSIFDNYENFLPGDKKHRQINLDSYNYENLNEGASGFEEEVKDPSKKLWVFVGLVIVVVGILIGQLLRLQIKQGGFNLSLAKGNRLREREVLAPRGIIYDSKKVALVESDASYNLEIYPLDLPKKEDEKQKFYQSLSSIIQMPQDQIARLVKAANLADPVVLKENLDRDTAMILQVKLINLPGVVVKAAPVRKYKQISGLSPILGYVGKTTEKDLEENSNFRLNEIIGKDGLEKTYQKFLKGQNGASLMEVDAKGRAQRLISNRAPVPGDSLTLSLDSALEEYIASVLQSELTAAGATAGAVVAINPQTGGVLSMVSLPTYDNNLFAKGIAASDYQNLLNDSSKPLFNRTTSGTYPSGSTIKPMVAAAGLQEGVITENTTIKDEGQIQVGNWTYPDWKAHGLVNVRDAIAESCDVFFYSIGGGWDKIQGLGVNKLHDYLVRFGLGKPTGIDLPSEASGLVPTPEWKEKAKKESWYLGDTYHMSIGQGDVLVTPLQMANAIAAISNGGHLLKPYLVQKIQDQNGNVVMETQKTVVDENFISAENIQIVREGMRQAVTMGSAKQFDDLPVMVGAKTGTAQFGDQDKLHSWMVAFAPYNDPQIAIAVIVEGGGEGYAVAGPVIKDTLNWYFTR